MSKMKNGFFIAVSCLTIGLAGCQKDEETPPAAATKTELISSSTWKFDTAAIDTDKNGSTDMAIPDEILGECDKNNIFTFVSNGTGTVDEGASKCDDSDPQTSPFEWAFLEDETKINFSGYDFSELDVNGEATIVSLTDDVLTLSKEASFGPLISANIIITLKH